MSKVLDHMDHCVSDALTIKETKLLQGGRCPDCDGAEIRGGPEGPGFQNVLCVSCRMKFNMPFAPFDGITGQRLGLRTEPTTSAPIHIPREGSMVREESDYGTRILHSCGLNSRLKGFSSTEYCGNIERTLVSAEDSYLTCRKCGLRLYVPASVNDTWEELTRYFEELEQKS